MHSHATETAAPGQTGSLPPGAPLASGIVPGLTTTKAAFINEAVSRGELYITQPWELYSEENHRTWAFLFERMLPRWERYATARFLEGVANLSLDRHQVPRLEDVNRFMAPRTGFRAKPVSGYVPAFLFFECLGEREFPTTITIRDGATPDYLPEPDIFHDIAGHVPMHTDAAFADTLARFGQVARAAAVRLAGVEDPGDRVARLNSVMRAMARFFWFTIEFGLMRDPSGSTPTGVRAYGSGLLSSYGELAHSVESPSVQRYPFQLEWVVNQAFEIDRYQPLLFVVDSFDQLFGEVERLEAWMLEGRLDDVAPGQPEVSDEDLEVALEAVRAAAGR